MEINSKLYFPQNRFSHQMIKMLFKMEKKGKNERGRSLIIALLKPDLCETSHDSSLIIFSSCFSRGCPFA